MAADPTLRAAEWLMLFGAVVWVVMLATGVMGWSDFLVHELFSVLALVVLWGMQRRQGSDS